MILRLIIMFLFPLQIFAQDITGIWTGTLTTENALVRYELSISENGGELGGYSLSIFTFSGVENIGVKKITLKKKKNFYFLEDHELIYDNYTTPGRRVLLTGKLNFTDSDTVLTGTFTTRSMDLRAPGQNNLNGDIRLQKQTDYLESGMLAQLDALNLAESLSFLSSPIKKMQQAPTDPAQKIIFSFDEKENSIASSPVVVKELPAIQIAPEKKEITAAEKIKAADARDVTAKKEIIQPTREIVKAIPEPVKQIPEKTKEIQKQETSIVAKIAEPTTIPATPAIKLPQNIFPGAELSANAAVDISKRETEIIRNVFFTGDSLVIRLYDNGEVDGDIVSVLLNGRIIMPNVKLIARAITQTIYLTPDLGDTLELVMYAENLGSLPPNTGLLTIQDGSERYSVNFSGDFNKNSAIILTRKK